MIVFTPQIARLAESPHECQFRSLKAAMHAATFPVRPGMTAGVSASLDKTIDFVFEFSTMKRWFFYFFYFFPCLLAEGTG